MPGGLIFFWSGEAGLPRPVVLELHAGEVSLLELPDEVEAVD